MPVYTNLHTNPRPTSGTGWSSVTGTGGTVSVTFPTDGLGPGGNNYRRQTWTAASTAVGGGPNMGTATNPLAVTPGLAYSATAYVRSSKAQRVRVNAYWWNSTPAVVGTFAQGVEVVLAANTWTELRVEDAVAPAGAASVRVQFVATPGTSASNWAVNDWMDVQAGTLVQGSSVPQPFHGSMADDANHDYAWTGAVDASTSTVDIIPDPPAGPAVPTGLTVAFPLPTQGNLSWDAAFGAAGGYDIDRNGTVIVQGHSGTTYIDTGLAPGTAYTYRVRSVG